MHIISYCPKCGATVSERDRFCAKCGYSLPQHSRPINQPQTGESYSTEAHPPKTTSQWSEKSGLITLLLAVFLGALGIHRFYVGRIGIGIAQLLTAGGCGIWVIVDIILLATGSLQDGEGKVVKLD